jgi:hypothetical protein
MTAYTGESSHRNCEQRWIPDIHEKRKCIILSAVGYETSSQSKRRTEFEGIWELAADFDPTFPKDIFQGSFASSNITCRK